MQVRMSGVDDAFGPARPELKPVCVAEASLDGGDQRTTVSHAVVGQIYDIAMLEIRSIPPRDVEPRPAPEVELGGHIDGELFD
jgi:hypothetical protein